MKKISVVLSNVDSKNLDMAIYDYCASIIRDKSVDSEEITKIIKDTELHKVDVKRAKTILSDFKSDWSRLVTYVEKFDKNKFKKLDKNEIKNIIHSFSLMKERNNNRCNSKDWYSLITV